MEKYYVYFLNKTNNNIKKIASSNKKDEVIHLFKKYIKLNKNISDETHDCIILKYQKVNYNENQPIKMVFGPIKITISFYKITKRLSIKDSKDDNRNNHIFLTIKFLEKNSKNVILKYMKQIIDYANRNKLEKRLLAPKTIDQINIT
jgi:hypothetical protein